MKKLLLLILFPFYAFSQNTVTYPAGTQQGTAVFRTYGTLTDSLSKRYFLQFAGGKGNEIYTATYISKYFARLSAANVFSQSQTFSNGATINGTVTGTNWSINPTSQDFFHMSNPLHSTGVDFETNQGNTSISIVMNSNDATHPLMGVLYSPSFTGTTGLYEMLDNNQANVKRILTTDDSGTGVLTYSLTKGYGLTPFTFNNSANVTLVIDTASTNSIVSKDRLTNAIALYYTKIASDARFYPVSSNPANYLANPMTTLGDIIYGAASGTPTRLAGNTTSSMKFLTQTGTGTVSAAPVYFDLFGTTNTWNGGQTFSQPLNFGSNTFYTVTGTGPVWLTNSGANLNKLLAPTSTGAARTWSLQDKTGTIALTNDNVSQFTNDAGYLTGASGVTSITGTTNQIIRSSATGAVTLSLPQSIAPTSNVTFNIITANGQASSFFKSLNIINTFGTPQSWGLINDLSGSNDGNFGIINITSGTTAFQIDKSNNTTLLGNLILNGTSGQPIFFNTAGTNTTSMGNHAQVIGGGGSTSDFNIYVQGNNPYSIWTNGALRFSIAGNGAATFSNSLSSFALMGNGTTPTVSVVSGAGAGTGATATIAGTNTTGTVTFTVGTSPGIGALFNITMANGFTFTSSANGVAQLNSTSAAAIPVGASFTVNASGTVLQVQIAGAALTAGSTYKINYICIGY